MYCLREGVWICNREHFNWRFSLVEQSSLFYATLRIVLAWSRWLHIARVIPASYIDEDSNTNYTPEDYNLKVNWWLFFYHSYHRGYRMHDSLITGYFSILLSFYRLFLRMNLFFVFLFLWVVSMVKWCMISHYHQRPWLLKFPASACLYFLLRSWFRDFWQCTNNGVCERRDVQRGFFTKLLHTLLSCHSYT